MMGQVEDLANDLGFYGIYEHVNKENFNQIHHRACMRRDAIQEVLEAVMRIAFQDHIGIPHKKSDDVMIAEDMLSAVKVARGTSCFSQTFQIGPEPIPKIEKIEEE